MPFAVTNDDIELYYEDTGETGNAAGVPVIFIHGWPLSGASWEYQVTELFQHGIRCVTYDRRGFGMSDKPSTGYDYDTLADDLACIIDEIGEPKCIIVGFSMGGGEVVRYLARHGSSKVAKAVLIGAVPPFLLKRDDNPAGVDHSTFDQMIEGLRKDRPNFLANFNKLFFGAGMLNFSVSSEIMDWAGFMAMQASPIATLACVKAFSETDFRADCAMINTPTLIIHGDADQTVPIKSSSELTAKMIANATYKVYSGAPHALFFTEKDKLNADLLAFIND